jgi:phosphatidylserine/phosphatidylglycerophosphate/cardiolipin synthase-like enzyme
MINVRRQKMTDFENSFTQDGFTMKLWRGERMCLLAFDVEQPEDDFVGFAIKVKNPGKNSFYTLRNRLSFSYDSSGADPVTGKRVYLSTDSPFQKFRWIDFPPDGTHGVYSYRATKMHMGKDGKVKPGTSIDLDITIEPETYDGFLDVGFTRNFASSQAFLDRCSDCSKVIPANADDGLEFTKLPGDIYSWMGFEAYDLVFSILDEAVNDKEIELDVLAYDLNEGDIVSRLQQLGPRLRIVIDDSSSTDDDQIKGHGSSESAESKAAARLGQTAGDDHIRRTHLGNLQHNKIFILKRAGTPFKVLTGSTNFSYRGLYIQANNVLVFHSPEIAQLYGRVFDLIFSAPDLFKSNVLAATWHLIKEEAEPAVHCCFAPHKSSGLSLSPLGGAVDQATSSVLYSIAFLNQIRSGPTKQAFDRLMERPVFSYGISDKAGKLQVRKPDGSTGLVSFAYLASKAPEPFRSEWSGGKGIHLHHKFVVIDFNQPTAKVFTGSSNFAPSGEEGNGDNLIMIQDRKIAVSFAIEALRVFDHLHFRCDMYDAAKKAGKNKPDPIVLAKPRSMTGKPAWFESYYEHGSQHERDRLLFSK